MKKTQNLPEYHPMGSLARNPQNHHNTILIPMGPTPDSYRSTTVL